MPMDTPLHGHGPPPFIPTDPPSMPMTPPFMTMDPPFMAMGRG